MMHAIIGGLGGLLVVLLIRGLYEAITRLHPMFRPIGFTLFAVLVGAIWLWILGA